MSSPFCENSEQWLRGRTAHRLSLVFFSSDPGCQLPTVRRSGARRQVFYFSTRLAYPQVVKTTQKRMEDKRDNICEKASHFFAHRRDVWVHVLGLFLSKLRGYLSNAWFGTFPGVSLKSVNVGSLSWLYIAITGNIV